PTTGPQAHRPGRRRHASAPVWVAPGCGRASVGDVGARAHRPWAARAREPTGLKWREAVSAPVWSGAGARRPLGAGPRVPTWRTPARERAGREGAGPRTRRSGRVDL